MQCPWFGQTRHLAVELRRVMALEEYLQQLVEGHLARVEGHLRKSTMICAGGRTWNVFSMGAWAQ